MFYFKQNMHLDRNINFYMKIKKMKIILNNKINNAWPRKIFQLKNYDIRLK